MLQGPVVVLGMAVRFGASGRFVAYDRSGRLGTAARASFLDFDLNFSHVRSSIERALMELPLY